MKTTLWWRDDDAVTATPALETLLTAAEDAGISPVLAVIPGRLNADLPNMLAGRRVHVALHGWTHTNHQPSGSKKAELGDARPLGTVLQELKDGRTVLQDAFGPQFLPMLVPPWNRTIAAVQEALPSIGLRTISRYDQDKPLTPGVPRIDTHLDLIDWKGTRGFIGVDAALSRLADVIARDRASGRLGPIGVLSHHLDEVEETARFLRILAEHMAEEADWLAGQDVLNAAVSPRETNL